MLRLLLFTLIFCVINPIYAASSNILNIYIYSDEIPKIVIHQFEEETGIKVNFSTYSTNEIMYAKLLTNKHPVYDIIMPSSYFVNRMRQQNLLLKLNKEKLPNLKNINPALAHPGFDPNLDYAIPYVWGVTGIFYNDQYIQKNEVQRWSDLWKKKYRNQIVLLNDVREVFSATLFSLGFSPNTNDINKLKLTYQRLIELWPNIKLFSTDTITSNIIDEDAIIGMAWNGDVHKASLENKHIKFVYPKDGFIIWTDNIAISKNAPHPQAAYQFINFLFRADIAETIAKNINFAISNTKGQAKLPASTRNSPVLYPNAAILKKGTLQTNINDAAMEATEKYWEAFKMQG